VSRPYHHGDLRRALLAAAAVAVVEQGPAGMSLRAVARAAGVSHAAPAHHFGDKAGLLTALAADGFDAFADALEAASAGGLVDFGVAYVRFALEQRARFEVMFRPELLHQDDPALCEAAVRAWDVLHAAATRHAPPGRDPDVVAYTLWSLVHGFTTLALTGNVPATDPDAVLTLARSVIDAASLAPVDADAVPDRG
jgi:AcrR family transcriptional regulator